MATGSSISVKPHSRRKIALVIGNSNYAETIRLPNAQNDATQMASTLKDIGFIIYGNRPQLNLSYKEMRLIIVDFSCFIEPEDMVLFYFAGHGTQWEDQNYLIPTNNFTEQINDGVKMKMSLSGPELVTHAINAQSLLSEINDRHPFIVILLLDCCRTYHLRNAELLKHMRGEQESRPHGLKAMPPKVGSLIAFACAPGTTADDGNNGERNGLFTKHLLKHIKTPNEDIQRILTDVTNGVMEESGDEQIPHVTSVLRYKDIYLCTSKQEFKYHKWKQHATTVVGGDGAGQQLSRPQGISVDQNKTILIADWGNDRIVRWERQTNTGTVSARGNVRGNRMDQLNGPTDVIVDQRNHSIIVADYGNRRVVRCFDHSQSKQQILIDNIVCWGLAMDREGFLYVSDYMKHEVRRWKEGEGTLVAGGNGQGNQLNQLSYPSYLFVDDQQSVYVSDYSNHRVMKWRKGGKEGVIVAGGNGHGNSLNQLFYPLGLSVDQWGQIYVADMGNHRVMRWREGERDGEIVVGGNGPGQGSNQLYDTIGLSFDDEGNIYVADRGNDRIQKFDLILS